MWSYIEMVPTYVWWLIGIPLYFVGGYLYVQSLMRNKKQFTDNFKKNLKNCTKTANKISGNDLPLEQADIDRILQRYLFLCFCFWFIPVILIAIRKVVFSAGNFVHWALSMLTLPMR